MRPAGREGGAGISSIVITDPPKWALSPQYVLLSAQFNSTIPVKGTGLGTITRIDVQARKPDVGPAGYGPIATATSTNQFATWNANVVIPNIEYTRILARAYNNAGFVWQTFNDVKYQISTMAVLPPPLPGGATGCPPINVDTSFVVTVPPQSIESVIQNAINSVKSHTGGGKVLVKDSSTPYNITKGLVIDDSSGIIFGGADGLRATTRLKCATSDIDILSAGSDSNICIQNVDLDGANISKKCIDFHSNTNLLIQHCIFQRHNYPPSPGVYFGNTTNGTFWDNITKDHKGQGDKFAVGGKNIRIIGNEGSGMVAQNGTFTSGGIDWGEVAYNYVHDTISYAGFSFENQSYPTRNVDLHHNRVERLYDGNAVLFVTTNQDADHAAYVFDGITVRDNIITDMLDYAGGSGPGGAVVTRTGKLVKNLNIFRNKMTNANYDAIQLINVENCYIKWNEIIKPYPYAIKLINCRNVHIGAEAGDNGYNTIVKGTAVNLPWNKGPTKANPYSFTGCTDVWINGVSKANGTHPL
jgi:hypothetical protein